jgi:hypothetical protein
VPTNRREETPNGERVSNGECGDDRGGIRCAEANRYKPSKGGYMTEFMQREQALEPDWKTGLKAYPLPTQVLIAGLLIAILFAIVLLCVGFLILGALILSGTVAAAVLKSVFTRSSDREG